MGGNVFHDVVLTVLEGLVVVPEDGVVGPLRVIVIDLQ